MGTEKPLPDNQNNLLRRLLIILTLEQQARSIDDISALRFHIVNESRRAISFDQGFLWEKDIAGRVSLTAVTGVSSPDETNPYFQSFRRLLLHLLQEEESKSEEEKKGEVRVLTKEMFPAHLHAEWDELRHQEVLWSPLLFLEKECIGGLWLNRSQKWTDKEKAHTFFLTGSYAQAIHGLQVRRLDPYRWLRDLPSLFAKKRVMAFVLLVCFLLGFIPIRQSVVAPAEVVAVDPFVIASPANGVIKQFYVEPNAPVKKGELLFKLDGRMLKSEYDISRKALAVARANYDKALNRSFYDADSKMKLRLLKALVEQKEVETRYSKEMLERIIVKAPADGVLLFNDPNDWLGKPVSIGERIMGLANPKHSELQIWMPVNDALSLEKGALVKAFLGVDPTHPIEAKLIRAGYEAQLSPHDVLSFRLNAQFVKRTSPPRIGMKAMAKVYGSEVSLFYYLLRKPYAYMRQVTGW